MRAELRALRAEVAALRAEVAQFRLLGWPASYPILVPSPLDPRLPSVSDWLPCGLVVNCSILPSSSWADA